MAEVTIQQAKQIAVEHHRAGRLAEAETIYRQILQREPNYADALLLLGVLLGQTGRLAEAVNSTRRAIALSPNDPDAYNNLGVALNASGERDEAIDAYRRTILLQPDHAEAHSNLGDALRNRGDLDEAIAACRKAIALVPNFPGAHNNLGAALTDLGQYDQAIAAYRTAIRLKPDFAEAYGNLGAALANSSRHDEAVAAYRTAIQLKPDCVESYKNLGNVLSDCGRHDDAIAAHRSAIHLKPDSAKSWDNLGSAQQQAWLLADAAGSFRRAVELDPRDAQFHLHLSLALRLATEERQGWAEHAAATAKLADHQTLVEAEHLALQNSTAARKDILIVVHDQLEYVRRCIESIRSTTEDYQLYVWDNASGLETRRYLESCGAHIVRSEQNLGFILPNNRLAAIGNSPYLILLNSDTVVTRGWDRVMLGWLQQHQDVAEVGYGVRLKKDGIHTDPRYGYDADYLEGWCACLPRHIFNRLGLFDETNLIFAYGEDADFSQRLREAGKRIYALRTQFVHHFGGRTSNRVANHPDIAAAAHRNSQYIKSRWPGVT